MRHTLRPETASPAPLSTRVRLALVMLMIVGGCGESPASKPHPAADPRQAPVANSAENPIEFSQWQTLSVATFKTVTNATPRPVRPTTCFCRIVSLKRNPDVKTLPITLAHF